MRARVHGLTAIVLGLWETVAYVTRRIPTVSSLYARWRDRQRVAALVSLFCWLTAVGHHLATYRDKDKQ